MIAAVALATGIFFGTKKRTPDLSELAGFSFPEPEKLTDVALIDHNNEPLTAASFKDQWTFIYVGYTFCPDYCPATLSTLNRMDSLIKAENGAEASTLLVSVDPERDTPQHLKEYVKFFNADFTAATGTPEEIRKFADQVSAVYALPDDRTDPNYLVDHSSSVILINPDAAVQAIFTPPQEAGTMAKDFNLLVAHYNSR